MNAQRIVEFESGLCVRWPGKVKSSDLHKLSQQAGSRVKMIRDVWDSLDAFQKYKAAESEAMK